MVTRSSTRSGTLGPGSRIAVVGGGPAGSSFALFALHLARQRGLDLRVTVFEPRDFSRPGPHGCNMCAGLIPVHALWRLQDIGVTVPDTVVQERIRHYSLHTAAGLIPLEQPDPAGDVISVYRGSGPLGGPAWPHDVSFDRFLLETARARGAEVLSETVTAVTRAGRSQVTTTTGIHEADLVVLASGINRSRIDLGDIDYRPPPREQMAQCELHLGAERVREALGGSVHIVLARILGLSFGTLIPKGPYVNVSLLGSGLQADSIARFLALPEVASLLPGPHAFSCTCRPRIAVGPARPYYADHFVAIGDAGVTKLYKNGIGSAVETAHRAALTAIGHGVSAQHFRERYEPLCRDIDRDNHAGRFLFGFSRVFRRHRLLTLPHLHSVIAERSLPQEERIHSRFLWAMFTGAYPYRRLVRMAMHPRLHLRLLRGALAAMRSRHPDSSPLTSGPDDAQGDDAHQRDAG
jgi:flavin-dependent dehydrogenase